MEKGLAMGQVTVKIPRLYYIEGGGKMASTMEMGLVIRKVQFMALGVIVFFWSVLVGFVGGNLMGLVRGGKGGKK